MTSNKNRSFENKAEETHNKNLKKKVIVATAWTVGARWGIRILGLISTVILARLLDPEDFGLVAMAAVFTGIVIAFTQMETDIGLIRLNNLDDDHFNTAWTISIFGGVVACGGLLMLAPIAADYYDEQRISEIFTLIAFAPLIASFANPKTALFRKDFHFEKEFQYLVLTKLLTVSLTIYLAFTLRDYRVLVYGILAGAIFQVVIGYTLLPYLPRFSLGKRHVLLSFSIWIVVRNASMAAMERIEQVIIGANLGPERTAYYNMGGEIGGMISNEIALPIARTLLPAISMIQDDQERMKRGILMYLAAVSIVLPFGFGLASLAPEFIAVVLGDKWLPAKDVLEILSISASFAALGMSFNPVIMVKGNIRSLALVGIAGSVIMLIGAQTLIVYNNLSVIAGFKVVLHCVFFFAMMYLAVSHWPGEMRKILYIISRPLGASVVMYILVKYGQLYFEFPAIWALLVWPFIGALFFAAILMSFWAMAGRPFGLEYYIQHAYIKIFQKT